MPNNTPRRRNYPLFHMAHYNILAAQVREHLFSTYADRKIHSGSMLRFTFSLTKRLKQDNPEMDHLKFLDACSPDPTMYPLSELWED
jgi:hypothetical protein